MPAKCFHALRFRLSFCRESSPCCPFEAQADMGQQRSHAQLRIRGHCADREGSTWHRIWHQCQLLKKLLCHFIAHGIRYKHNDAFPHTADVCAVKCNLPFGLECRQIAGQALAPMHRQRVKGSCWCTHFPLTIAASQCPASVRSAHSSNRTCGRRYQSATRYLYTAQPMRQCHPPAQSAALPEWCRRLPKRLYCSARAGLEPK